MGIMHKFLAYDLVILTIDYLPEMGYNVNTIKEEEKGKKFAKEIL